MPLSYITIAHIAAAIFAIIELGLTAYIISWYSGHYLWTSYSYSPSRVNFALFASIWSLLVLAYLALSPARFRIPHKFANLAITSVTAIFWFAAAIALAVFVGGPYDCGANSACGSLEAAVAFAFFLWALFTGLAVLDALEVFRGRGAGGGGSAVKPQANPGA